MIKSIQALALVAVFGAAVGCGGSSSADTSASTSTSTSTSSTVSKANDIDVSKFAEAGVPVSQSADPKFNKAAIQTVAMKLGPARNDPFALRADESQFDQAQNTERVFGQLGFSNDFTPTSSADEAPAPLPEAQPYRRLAGVVVGDSVLALIDMGNNQTYLIRPGMQIPDSEWTVASIDMDKAVLKRSGSRLPHEITVRLELPPPGAAGIGTGGGFAPGVPGGGGMPGQPPSGFGPPPGFGGGGSGDKG